MKGKGKLYQERGYYVAVPESVLKLLPLIGYPAFALFTYLLMRANADRNAAWPSYETIIQDTGLARNTIAKACHILQDYHLLRRQHRPGTSTLYILSWPMPTVPSKDLLPSAPAPPIAKEGHLPIAKEGREPDSWNQTHVITEEPESTQSSVNPSPSTPATGTHKQMVAVLLDVCHQGTEAAKYAASTAKDLRAAGYTADQLRAWYGPDGWWYTVYTADWSEKFKKPPSLAQVVKTAQLAAEAHGAAAISVEATRNADGSYNI